MSVDDESAGTYGEIVMTYFKVQYILPEAWRVRKTNNCIGQDSGSPARAADRHCKTGII
jgi:hypothetical protein